MLRSSSQKGDALASQVVARNTQVVAEEDSKPFLLRVFIFLSVSSLGYKSPTRKEALQYIILSYLGVRSLRFLNIIEPKVAFNMFVLIH